MAKFEPICRRKSCSVVRGFGKVDHPHLGVFGSFTCMAGTGWWCLGAAVGAGVAGCVLGEGVEATSVAGTVEIPLALDEVVETLDGTFDSPLKALL